MRTSPLRWGIVLGLTMAVAATACAQPSADDLAFYESKVRPLLIDHCYSCHSATASKLKGELRLDSPSAWMKGGASGPALVAGKPDESLIVQAVRRNHKDVEAMPPQKPLTADQVAVLVDWVRRGAPAPAENEITTGTKETIEDAKRRWPFTPVPATVPVPAVQSKIKGLSEIDRFLLAKLEAKKLIPLGEADRRTLIRRVTYDLIGLPPTPEEIDAFEKDPSPNAWAKVIDRLLASPHYGERWGRHWLDVVRYADTAGDNSDFPIPQMVKYRNWVIDAINRDLPYDQFVKEQIAGDRMGGKDEVEKHARIIATGYLANARRFGSRVDDYPQHLTIEDTIDNLGRAFLGMTLNCARCHDHKFDPISTRDYYALYGIFNSSRYPWPGIELQQFQKDLVALAPADEVKKVFAERESKRKQYDEEIKKLFEEKGKAKDDTGRQAVQKKIDAVKKQQRETVNAPFPFPTAYAMAEGMTIGNVNVQLKGDPEKAGEPVSRRFVSILGGHALPDDDSSSGRLALANWIASPENPLFARVMVNRVWHHHFGRGLVGTPNDFGKQGAVPTHPELLDYLARSFITKGWSLKSLHRQILMSQAYRRASIGDVPGIDMADPNNELLSRFRRRRLDAESIRDGMLFVSGQLDTTPGQEHPFPDPRTWNFTQHNPFRAVYDTNRRSVYLMTQRIARHPYLAIFDGADTGASTGARITSTTALQSLYFLNDQFVHDRAKGLAKQLANANSDAEKINRVYRVLFARPPTADERAEGLDYLKTVTASNDTTVAWQSYLRSLLRLNEFVYIN
jgi:hypothetical protein